MNTLRPLILPALLLLLTGCFEEEDPIEVDADATRQEIGMGSDYGDQVFFSFAEGTVTAVNRFTDFDLLFWSDGSEIRLNSATNARIARTSYTTFDAVPVDADDDADFRTDFPGQTSPLAGLINGATTDDTVVRYDPAIHILDAGIDEAGDPRGVFKLQFVERTPCCHVIRFAPMNVVDAVTATVPRDPARRAVAYSLVERRVADHEPVVDRWDLLFTQYTHPFMLDGDTVPYLVRGVLINDERIDAAVDTAGRFEDLDRSAALARNLTDRADVLGYDWKLVTIDGTAASYAIDEEKYYIVQTADGGVYKMRFVDFLNDSGERGYPEFEYVPLY